MKKFYLATIIAIIVTVSIASHLLVIGALGPATPGYFAGMRAALRGVPRRLKHWFDGWVAAAVYRSSLAHDPGLDNKIFRCDGSYFANGFCQPPRPAGLRGG